MTKSPTGKETLNTRRPEGEVGGGGRRHVARMREGLVSEINTVIIIIFILTTSNAAGDSYQHNSSASLTRIAEAVRTHRKEI